VAVVEAAAAGLPVVAARTPPLEEAVEDGVTGVLVPARAPEPLADAILGLLRDPRRRRALGAAGRRRATERFSLATAARRLEAFYRELLATRRRDG
jgi:glycosyltransferase involved in cell wall biosynthesis